MSPGLACPSVSSRLIRADHFDLALLPRGGEDFDVGRGGIHNL